MIYDHLNLAACLFLTYSACCGISCSAAPGSLLPVAKVLKGLFLVSLGFKVYGKISVLSLLSIGIKS